MEQQLKNVRNGKGFAPGMVAIAAWIALSAIAGTANASVTEYTNRAAWEAAVGGPYTTIGFTEHPSFTFLTTEYSHLGVTFDGHLYVGFHGDFDGFPEDGSGVLTTTQHPTTTIFFSQPIHAFSFNHLGLLSARFFSGTTLVHEVVMGGGGIGFFGGILSTESFDSIMIANAGGGTIGIDDIHFAVPAPGALIPLLVPGVFGARSRRRIA